MGRWAGLADTLTNAIDRLKMWGTRGKRGGREERESERERERLLGKVEV